MSAWIIGSLLYIVIFLQAETGCTASAGFGSNRLQARLATRKAKPNGQFYLEPASVPLFMLDIEVKDLPGKFTNFFKKNPLSKTQFLQLWKTIYFDYCYGVRYTSCIHDGQ